MRSGGNRSKKVKVWVRIRPSQDFANETIVCNPETKVLEVHVKKEKQKGVANNQVSDWSFRTDGIFSNASQEEVYDAIGADLIKSGLSGYNGTVMCYGQTGAGKTFTITGATEMFHNRGLVPRALSHLYKEIAQQTDLAVTVRIAFLEIYNDTMVDLLSSMPDAQELNQQNLTIVEENGGVYVKGLKCFLAQTEEEALDYLFEGETNRATASHALNARSSRSHTIFTIYIDCRSRFQSNAKITVSKINFVDLAGSERLQKTNSTGKMLQEASYINKSLTFLEQTVIALAEKGRDHVPYRQSKLTHYLKDSIGGNCKTILVANIWGDKKQVEETISTMRFATRMMCINSDPIENKQYDPNIMVKNLEAEIIALKKELAMHNTLHNQSHINYEPISEQQRYELRLQVSKYLRGELDEIDLINVRQIQSVFEIFRDFCVASKQEAELRAGDAGGSRVLADDSAVLTDSEPNGGVGEVDGRNFGLTGPAGKLDENSVFLQNKRREAKKRQGASSGGTSPPRHEEPERGTPDQRPSTPPSRSAAFEEFKREQGSRIHEILTNSKTQLSHKKKEYSRLANQVNTNKMEIDRSRMRLEALKVEREVQGTAYTDEGEIIISEEEFLEIKKLRELKATYKSDFESLKSLKHEIQYVQKQIDSTRQCLIQEFDKWYTESFLDPDKAQNSLEVGLGQNPAVITPQPYEDPLERFDRVKHEELENTSDLEAYNRAKEATIHRQIYARANYQGQPVRRKPGTPVINIRDKPPSNLQVYS